MPTIELICFKTIMLPTSPAPDGHLRCHWCMATPDYLRYHDTEWGFPVTDDRRLFEKICLEGFQSGLSWLTILRKRENFRAAFCGFDYEKVAQFTEADVQHLLQDEGIIRHRGKIEATINNAQRAIELIASEGSLAAYFWRYQTDPNPQEGLQAIAQTPASQALSKDLKKRGWKFVGPTTAYAFMQAMGIVNDHSRDCVVRAQVEQTRKRFTKPR